MIRQLRRRLGGRLTAAAAAFVVVTASAAAVNWAFTLGVGSRNFWVVLLVATVLGLVIVLVIEQARASADSGAADVVASDVFAAAENARRSRLTESLRQYPARVLADTDPVEDGMYTVSELALRATGGDRPPYSPRDADDAVGAAVVAGYCLVAGPTGGGKSRTAAEACWAALPADTQILIPWADANVSAVIDDYLPEAMALRPVLWLDNLHDYLDDGRLDASHIRKWLLNAGRIVATIWDAKMSNYEADRAVAGGGKWEAVTVDVNLCVMTAEPPSANELRRAEAMYPGVDFSAGIAEPFKTTRELVRRLCDSVEACPAAYALVRAVVDWYRCGLGASMPEGDARALFPHYFREAQGRSPVDEEFETGLAYATERLLRVAALVEHVGANLAGSDVIRYKAHTGSDDLPRLVRNIREETWTYVIDHSSGSRLETVARVSRYMGRPDVSARASREVVTQYRLLAGAGKPEDLHNLAGALNNLGGALIELHQLPEAIAAMDEVIELRQQVIALGLDERDLLAGAIINRAIAVSRFRSAEEALEGFDAAVRIYDELLEAGRSDIVNDLAAALTNRGVVLNTLHMFGDAVDSFDRAIAIRRELVGLGRDDLLADLASTISNRATSLAAERRLSESLASSDEAVAIYRGLCHPDQFSLLNTLAAVLMNRGSTLNELGRMEDAMDSYDESVAIRRGLVDVGRVEHSNDLASSIMNQSSALAKLKRIEDAWHGFAEVIEIRRGLVASGQIQWRGDLAIALMNGGSALAELGRFEEACASYDEAERMYGELVREGRREFLSQLAKTRINQATSLTAMGHFLDAEAACVDGVAIYRELVAGGRRDLQGELPRAEAVLARIRAVRLNPE